MAFSLSSLTSWFTTTEQDVINVIADIKNGVAVAETDLTAALNWVAANAPTIVSDLQIVLGIAQAFGVVSPATLVAANAAVAALNAVAAAQNAANKAGTTGLVSDAQTLVNAYGAYTQAGAAVSTAKASVASSVTVPKAA